MSDTNKGINKINMLRRIYSNRKRGKNEGKDNTMATAFLKAAIRKAGEL